MNPNEDKYYDALTVTVTAIAMVVSVIFLSWLNSYLELSILSGSTLDVITKLVLFLTASLVITFIIAMLMLEILETLPLNRMKEVTSKRFEGVSASQSKREHLVALLFLVLTVVVGCLYILVPEQIVLSVGVLTSGPIGFFWLLHRNREKSSLENESRWIRVVFKITHYATITSFSLSIIVCQFVLVARSISDCKLSPDIERAVHIYQYAEAIILGFLVGALCEYLAKKYPMSTNRPS